jgi:hypothetical protein
MNKTMAFMIFIVGTAIGSAATWQYFKKKYARIAQEEIDSVKKAFSKREENPMNRHKESLPSEKENPNVEGLAEKAKELGYTNYSNSGCEEKTEHIDKPYVISSDEFGECDDYEKISLFYYADGSLADDNDELIDDVENAVGFDSLNGFGEYEDDSVFVRNDRLKCDYEILMDQRAYSEVANKKPHYKEV